MSVTIGIGYKLKDKLILEQALRKALQGFNYAVLDGVKQLEADVQLGLRNFLNTGVRKTVQEKYHDVFVFQTPDNPKAALAYGIYEEFAQKSMDVESINFLMFIRKLKQELCNLNSEIFFFFCTEFNISDEVRYISGSFVDFEKFLSLPDAWLVYLWSPITERIQEKDCYPLVFNIDLEV